MTGARRQTLLAVIGPSGVGKTSLLRAGLIPDRPVGWAAVACAPGGHPFVALGQALAPLLAADAEAMAELFGGVSDAVQGPEPDRLVVTAEGTRASRGRPELLSVDRAWYRVAELRRDAVPLGTRIPRPSGSSSTLKPEV